MKLLMVCLGNICRSPLAEGIMAHKAALAGLDHEVDSAGMISYHAGDPPDARSIAVARKHGIDISGQRARKFMPGDYDAFDLIFSMDHDVHADILAHARTDAHRKKVHLLLAFAGYPEDRFVPDPYYGDRTQFEDVYRLIDDACGKIIGRLR